MAVNYIPDGYHSVTPYLNIRGAARALEFYQKAFGAEVALRMDGPDGTIAHAEMRIGDSLIMMADEAAEWNNKSPEALGGTSVGFMIYVPDADAVFKRAIELGGREVQPVQDQFYGDRSGQIDDPFGHRWTIATHIEDISPEEMARRAEAYTASQGA